MREWTVTLTSQQYTVGEAQQPELADALERLSDDLALYSDVVAPAVSLHAGSFGATLVLSATDALAAADHGGKIFREALAHALEPIRHPAFASELGVAHMPVGAPEIASVNAAPEPEDPAAAA